MYKRQAIKGLIENDVNVSKRTMQRYLCSKDFKYGNIKKQICLTNNHKNKRFQILQELLKDRVDFSRVGMTDKKVFRLDGPDNWFSYYGSKGNKQMRLLRHQRGSSIMCHCTALSDGQFHIIFCPNVLNSDSYITLTSFSIRTFLAVTFSLVLIIFCTDLTIFRPFC